MIQFLNNFNSIAWNLWIILMKNDSLFLLFNFLIERLIFMFRIFNYILLFTAYLKTFFLWVLTNFFCLIWVQVIWIFNSTLMTFILLTYSLMCFINRRWWIIKFIFSKFFDDSMFMRECCSKLTKNDVVFVIFETWLLITNSIDEVHKTQLFCK